MTLVDSSVWIDHIRSPHPQLCRLLEETQVLTHPVVIGELAMGRIRGRNTFLGNLRLLPKANIAHDDEVLDLIEIESLSGKGLSWGDACILASALLSECTLLTRDRGMQKVAQKLGILENNSR